jgi:hypothetical protein
MPANRDAYRKGVLGEDPYVIRLTTNTMQRIRDLQEARSLFARMSVEEVVTHLVYVAWSKRDRPVVVRPKPPRDSRPGTEA